MENRKYGYKRDSYDARDLVYSAPLVESSSKKRIETDLRNSFMPEIYNQGNTSSCTYQAIAAIDAYVRAKEKLPKFNPSRLFGYWCERSIEGTTHEDEGAQIRNGMKALNKFGICSEDMWPFDEKKVFVEPSKQCFDDAKNHTAVVYMRVDSTNERNLLHILQLGVPYVFGMVLHDSFESDEVSWSGYVPVPKKGEKEVGAHAMVICGNKYVKDVNHFIVRNSWGKKMGDKGYYYIPSSMITDRSVSSDFWMLTMAR